MKFKLLFNENAFNFILIRGNFNFKKIIPIDIYNLFTPVSLAFWIMGDGEIRASGIALCTDSFKVTEVVTLINVLIIKYNLNCTLTWKTNPSGKKIARIYFPSKEMGKLIQIVNPHIIPSMKHKITPTYKKKINNLFLP